MKRAAALLALVLAGCAGDPPSIPAGLTKPRAAVLRAWSPAEGEIRVLAVDNVEIGKVSHVYLSAGEHQVTVRWSGGQSITRVGQVRAGFRVGNSYVVEAEPDGALRTVRFDVVDKGPDYDPECLQQPLLGSRPKGRGC
ncbi:MAG TPA: hypothetical protein VN675_06975 [Burkholderiales bacterium]|nr:hypothetical protein [Burkholderiales bacterium]